MDTYNLCDFFTLVNKLNDKYYAYGFEVILNQSRFTSEWLVELTADNKERLIFSRDIVKGTYEFGGAVKTKGLLEKLNVYAEDIQEDSSVLLLYIENKKVPVTPHNDSCCGLIKLCLPIHSLLFHVSDSEKYSVNSDDS